MDPYTKEEKYAELVARSVFLANHTVIQLSKLAVNTVFKLGGLNLTLEYIIVKKGTKYVYFKDAEEPRQEPYRKRLDYEVYIPK